LRRGASRHVSPSLPAAATGFTQSAMIAPRSLRLASVNALATAYPLAPTSPTPAALSVC
jgi:hypothetical protein